MLVFLVEKPPVAMVANAAQGIENIHAQGNQNQGTG